MTEIIDMDCDGCLAWYPVRIEDAEKFQLICIDCGGVLKVRSDA